MASLVYHNGALGDFITTLPAMHRWKVAHGGDGLVLLGKPAHGELARHLFDEVWDAGAPAFAPLFSLHSSAAELAPRLRTVASALLFTGASSPLPRSFADLGVAEIVRQDPFPGSPVHVVDFHLSLFGDPASGPDRVPTIPAPGPGPAGRMGVALHSGSGSAKKNWPTSRFASVAAALEKRGEHVHWIVGPAEVETVSHHGKDEWSLLPLPELAARLSRCRLCLGNDSGVTHLAAAVGCPTVALFGGSDARIWSPRGPRVRIVKSVTSEMIGIEEEEVLRVCAGMLDGL